LAQALSTGHGQRFRSDPMASSASSGAAGASAPVTLQASCRSASKQSAGGRDSKQGRWSSALAALGSPASVTATAVTPQKSTSSAGASQVCNQETPSPPQQMQLLGGGASADSSGEASQWTPEMIKRALQGDVTQFSKVKYMTMRARARMVLSQGASKLDIEEVTKQGGHPKPLTGNWMGTYNPPREGAQICLVCELNADTCCEKCGPFRPTSKVCSDCEAEATSLFHTQKRSVMLVPENRQRIAAGAERRRAARIQRMSRRGGEKCPCVQKGGPVEERTPIKELAPSPPVQEPPRALKRCRASSVAQIPVEVTSAPEADLAIAAATVAPEQPLTVVAAPSPAVTTVEVLTVERTVDKEAANVSQAAAAAATLTTPRKRLRTKCPDPTVHSPEYSLKDVLRLL